jgi:hypothetical protein
MKLNIWAGALLLAAAVSVVGLAAADEAKKPAHPAPLTKAPSDQAPATDEKAMMEAWMKVATPGEAHKWLEPVVGTWDAKITMWMAPGAPPQESTGTSENKWVLGGRFVEQRYEGTFMGQPFSGVGYTGYDNYKKKYIGTWMDTMGTMMMISQGDAMGKTLTMTSTMDDIMTGKTATVKSEIKIVAPDHHVMEMWGPDPSGKQFKTMEIQYTRKK